MATRNHFTVTSSLQATQDTFTDIGPAAGADALIARHRNSDTDDLPGTVRNVIP